MPYIPTPRPRNNMSSHIEKLMELIDNASQHIPNGTYVEMCDTIKKIYDAPHTHRETYPAADTIVPIPPRGVVMPTADTIVPIPPRGVVMPTRSPYTSVPNIITTKAKVKSGPWKGDIITFDNKLYKVLRKTTTFLSVSLATPHPTDGFTFSLTPTDRVYCSQDTTHIVVFKRR
jgi:hypothetical protein